MEPENDTLTWNVDYYDSEELISNQGTVDFVTRPLSNNRMCIPDCAIINHQTAAYLVNVFGHFYRVQVDGIIYAENYAWQGSDIVGSSCQASKHCGGGGQSLVQVGVRFQPEFPLSPETHYSYWSVGEADSFKKLASESKSYNALYESGVGVEFWGPLLQPGKHFRCNLCQRDQYFEEGVSAGCTVLEMRLDGERELESYSYNVSVNGIFFRDRIDCSEKTSLGYRSLCRWLDEVSSGES